MAHTDFSFSKSHEPAFVNEVAAFVGACDAQLAQLRRVIDAVPAEGAEPISDQTRAVLQGLFRDASKSKDWALHQLCDRFAGKQGNLNKAAKDEARAFFQDMREHLNPAVRKRAEDVGALFVRGGHQRPQRQQAENQSTNVNGASVGEQTHVNNQDAGGDVIA